MKAAPIDRRITSREAQSRSDRAKPTNANNTPVYEGRRTIRNGPRSTNSWSFSIVTSTVKKRPTGYNSKISYDPANDMTLIVWTNLTVSLDGQQTANTLWAKVLDQIYVVSPLR